ncbi:DAK2 domain-containing protein, partial [Nesterenkonia sp. PF2B19]
RTAQQAAEATAELTARLGRSRVLGEKSRGTPDPGAVSFGMLAADVASWLEAR